METRQIKVITWIAVAIGAGMISVACFVYVNYREFGLAGATLTLFGVLLIGSAIWKNIDIAIGKEGGITAKFVRRLDNLEDNVQDVRKEVRDLETIVISENSALADVSKDKIKELRSREKRDRLRREGKLEGALELDPNDVISRMELIEKETADKNYRKVVTHTEVLRASNDSGVGYQAYPDLVLSYDQIGSAPEATKLIDELNNTISENVNSGYGYLARAEQLQWLQERFKRTQRKLSDKSLIRAVDALVRRIDATVDDLVS